MYCYRLSCVHVKLFSVLLWIGSLVFMLLFLVHCCVLAGYHVIVKCTVVDWLAGVMLLFSVLLWNGSLVFMLLFNVLIVDWLAGVHVIV